ncbi:MAG: hypothetical protein K2I10_00470 [Lachnospiraceae bacterium]|nr:hypothetical protein [Lachnospiraceae bacterium]
MTKREDRKENDLFYLSLIDCTARKTKNKRVAVKYSIPSQRDIGKLYKRLILEISREKNMDIMDAPLAAYNSYVRCKAEDFNNSFYYDAPQNILNAYPDGTIGYKILKCTNILR